MPRSRTQYYQVLRLMERFPEYIKTPESFYMLSEERQIELMAYEFIRSSEEKQLARSYG